MLRRLLLSIAFFALAALPVAAPTLAQTQAEADKLNAQVLQLYRSGNFTEATEIAQEVLRLDEILSGKNHPNVAASLNNLGNLYLARGLHKEAESNYKRANRIIEKAFGRNDPDVASSLNNLARVYKEQGRYAEAEPLYRRALEINEKVLGLDHLTVATQLNNLALLYRDLGRNELGASLAERSLEIREKHLGVDSPMIATALNNLALFYRAQKRFSDAELLYKRALSIRKKALGAKHPDVALALNNLAFLYQAQGKLEQAALAYREAVSILESELGQYHPDVALALNNLALVYEGQGRSSDQEKLLSRALSIFEEALGPEHPHVAKASNNLAFFHASKKNWEAAATAWGRAAAIVKQRTQQRIAGRSAQEIERNESFFAGQIKALYQLSLQQKVRGQYLSEMFELAQWGLSSKAASSLAQMAVRSASGSEGLAQIIREQQDLVAEWETTSENLIKSRGKAASKRDKMIEKVLADRLAAIDLRLGRIDERLAKEFPDYTTLVRPTPASVADVQNNLGDDEALILFFDTDDSFKPLAEETFVWVITKTNSKIFRSELGTAAIRSGVAALRCGLDRTSWAGAGQQKCLRLLNLPTGAVPGDNNPLPFDVARAHELYKGLLAGAEDILRGKENLIVVPSGPLTKLPLHTLVTRLPEGVQAGSAKREIASIGIQFRALEEAELKALGLTAGRGAYVAQAVAGGPAAAAGLQEGDVLLSLGGKQLAAEFDLAAAVAAQPPGQSVSVDFIRAGERRSATVTLGKRTIEEWTPYFLTEENTRQIAWLARDHAMTVLPSVSSLKSLRRDAKPSRADRPMIGFGNPLLDGDQQHLDYGNWHKKQAQLARETNACRPTTFERVASLFALRGGVTPVATRGGLADLAHLKRQSPLPETADELCAVARDLGADVSKMRLGANATETEIKRLSENGDLARYRILHFATHGTLAGQLSGTTEPGLILTPPKNATEQDDGYLSGSEIASLKLDADWVILSACNTAGGSDETNAEALGGLARVFFYAGARALLVSHWEVYSEATVKLITKAARTIADGSVGRAEALRRAMLDMIDNGKPHEAHPAYWAPFVVVGEGAAG